MTRTRLYVNITDEEINILDERAKTFNYQSRTEFLTAILRAAAYGNSGAGIAGEVEEIAACSENLEVLRAIFFDVLTEHAFAVIAMRGPDAACACLSDDLKRWMYERCRKVPLDSDMEKWARLYYAIKKSAIIEYRIQVMTERYQEEHGIIEPDVPVLEA